MENRNTLDLSKASKKFLSVDSTVSGPEEASNGKQFFRAKFEMNVKDDDGYSGQSKAYTKLFFEDSHSLQYLKAQKCLEEGTPMKIKAARIIIPTEKKFYILDKDGEKQPKQDGGFRTAESITLFLLEDENPTTAFNQACARITRQQAWIEPDLSTDDDDDEEDKKALETKKNKK